MGQIVTYPLKGRKGGGKGGGGGGGGRVAQEEPNTLQSAATARVVDLISEGEIGGLVNGAQSILFNETRVQNPDGSFNFEGVQFEERTGLPNQAYIPGFPSVEREVSVNVEVTTQISVTRTISDPEVNAIRVKVRFPSLVFQNTSNGDLSSTTVQFAFDVQPAGGSFTEVLNETISGKNTSPYEVDYRIELTGQAPWLIRMRRITADATTANVQNETFFSSYTELIDAKLIYPDSAIVALTVDARQFGGDIPRRGFEIDGIKIRIPSNYDPVTRVYTGIWDGTFQVAVSDNPAWVLYDVLTNARYGLGDSIPESSIDKWSLFEIGQYCDEMVDDGFGGQEPRFTFNGVINNRQEAYAVLNTISSAFRGMIYWGVGAIVPVQDRPRNASKLVTPANVVNGEFTYAGSALKARHSVVLVNWNNPQDNYRQDIQVVEDQAAIQQFGYRQTDVSAFGCTSRGQAVRLGKWILDSERSETQLLRYTASLDHADISPGDIIDVVDPQISGRTDMGGRCTATDTSTLVLDRVVTLEAGQTYSIAVALPDNQIGEANITNGIGNHQTITLETPLAATPVDNAIWAITATNVEPRPFRVVSIAENDKHLFEVTALEYDPNKYARVEQDLILESPSYTINPTGPFPAPFNFTASEYLFQSGAAVVAAATISFEIVNDPRLQFFEVQQKRPGDTQFEGIGTFSAPTFDVTNIVAGIYEYRARGVTGLGDLGPWGSGQVTLLGIEAPPSDVENFNIQISNQNAFLTWDQVPDLDLSHYRIRHSALTTGATWNDAVDVANNIRSTSISVPALVGTYMIKAVDFSNVESVNPTLIISNIAGLLSFNVVENIQESPLFPGVKVNTVATGGVLRLVSADTMDEWTSLSVVTSLAFGVDGIAPEGFYNFEDTVDLQQVFTSRVTATIQARGSDTANFMSTWPTLSGVGSLAGADQADWSVELQVRTSQEDPVNNNWSDWAVFSVGDYTARAFQFRVRLRSFRISVSAQVTDLNVTIDMPDRIISDNDIICPAAGLRVNFSPPFLGANPVAVIDAQDLASTERYEKTNVDATGFDLRFFDSGGAGIQKTFDWLAQGYGRQGG